MSESNWEQNANAIFLPIPDSLDALRRSTIQKLLAGASASRFVVTHEDDYLPGVANTEKSSIFGFKSAVIRLA